MKTYAPDDVGMVRTQTVRLFTPQNPLLLAQGGQLSEVEIAYETYGELNADHSNAVFICHALTGDAHAAGWHEGAKRPGWWDNLIGPGKPLDTDRFFVICPNLLGGCQGSSGPSSLNPDSGEVYGMDFPLLMMSDLVSCHRELLKHFQISQLLAAIGGSLGGMQVLEWGLSYPQDLQNAVVVAASSRLTAQNIAFSAVARRAIMSDENFQGGQYAVHGTNPEVGLSIARMMAHITYLSEDALTDKFGRELRHQDRSPGFGVDFEVESYLAHQGKAFVERFDALSYIYLTRVMDYFDPFENLSALDALKADPVNWLVMSFDSDWRFDTVHSRSIVRDLEHVGQPVSFREISAPWGHDSFLLDVPQYHATLRAFLDHAYAELPNCTERSTHTERFTCAEPPTHTEPHSAKTKAAVSVSELSELSNTGSDELQPKRQLRDDLQILADLIPAASRVLDLGCHDGDLLDYLIRERGCVGTGVEIDLDAVCAVISRGIPLIELDIDYQLGEFADDSYDVVVLSRTIQAIRRPQEVLEEIVRIGSRLIISVPNFAWWGHRLRLLRGRMPMSKELPYKWYNTPNLRFTSLKDIEVFFQNLGLVVEQRIPMTIKGEPLHSKVAANLFAGAATYVLRKS